MPLPVSYQEIGILQIDGTDAAGGTFTTNPFGVPASIHTALIVGVVARGGATPTVIAVDASGSALTRAVRIGDSDQCVEWWYLMNPPVGPAVDITAYLDQVVSGMTVEIIYARNVKSVNGLGATGTTSGVGGNVDLTLQPTKDNALVLTMLNMVNASGFYTPNPGQGFVNFYLIGVSDGIGYCTSKPSVKPSVAVGGVTTGPPNEWLYAAIELIPQPGKDETWPLRPSGPIRQGYGFETDVIEAYDGSEQRVRLAGSAPIVSGANSGWIEFDVGIGTERSPEMEFQLAKRLMAIGDRIVRVPFWPLATRIPDPDSVGTFVAAAPGAILFTSAVPADPINSWIRANDYVMLWRDEFFWEIVQARATSAISGGMLVLLHEPIGEKLITWGRGTWVVPMRMARISRSAMEHASAVYATGQVRFEIEPVIPVGPI
jgi:hypothetical protein